MVDLKTAIDELNTGKIEFDYKDDECCTTEGEVVVLLKRLAELEQSAADDKVKHGEWVDVIEEVNNTCAGITFKGFAGYKCSLCGRQEIRKEPYCHCGAKMDGKQ